MWGQVGQLYAYHGDVPAEVRLLKLTEEVGEVADAFISMHGLNARKGAVLPQPGRADAEWFEHGLDQGRADRAGISSCLLGYQQVRIAAAWPALMSVAQPPAGQGGGDLIEGDHLALEAPPDGQRSRGQVEVGRLEPHQVSLGHCVDGDQGDGEPRCRAAGAVEAPGEAFGGQRLREPGRGG
jgi:hypothetical protein